MLRITTSHVDFITEVAFISHTPCTMLYITVGNVDSVPWIVSIPIHVSILASKKHTPSGMVVVWCGGGGGGAPPAANGQHGVLVLYVGGAQERRLRSASLGVANQFPRRRRPVLRGRGIPGHGA